MYPEVFEVLERRQVEQHHYEEHLAKAELAAAMPLARRWDQPVAFPILKDFRKIIETTKECGGRQGHERDHRFVEDTILNHVSRGS